MREAALLALARPSVHMLYCLCLYLTCLLRQTSWIEKTPMIDRKSIDNLAEQVARQFRPKRIILFGSYAYGEPTADSDVDLLIVLPFRGKSLHKSLEILNRVDCRFPIDLIVRRPADTARRYAEGDPLIREALDRGEVLYERDS